METPMALKEVCKHKNYHICRDGAMVCDDCDTVFNYERYSDFEW